MGSPHPAWIYIFGAPYWWVVHIYISDDRGPGGPLPNADGPAPVNWRVVHHVRPSASAAAACRGSDTLRRPPLGPMPPARPRPAMPSCPVPPAPHLPPANWRASPPGALAGRPPVPPPARAARGGPAGRRRARIRLGSPHALAEAARGEHRALGVARGSRRVRAPGLTRTDMPCASLPPPTTHPRGPCRGGALPSRTQRARCAFHILSDHRWGDATRAIVPCPKRN